jgi:hypothetical protein
LQAAGAGQPGRAVTPYPAITCPSPFVALVQPCTCSPLLTHLVDVLLGCCGIGEHFVGSCGYVVLLAHILWRLLGGCSRRSKMWHIDGSQTFPSAQPVMHSTHARCVQHHPKGREHPLLHVCSWLQGSCCGCCSRLSPTFMNFLEPSSCAAAAEGPKARMPAAARSSARPATSGASGPTMTRSMPCALHQSTTCRACRDVCERW